MTYRYACHTLLLVLYLSNECNALLTNEETYFRGRCGRRCIIARPTMNTDQADICFLGCVIRGSMYSASELTPTSPPVVYRTAETEDFTPTSPPVVYRTAEMEDFIRRCSERCVDIILSQNLDHTDYCWLGCTIRSDINLANPTSSTYPTQRPTSPYVTWYTPQPTPQPTPAPTYSASPREWDLVINPAPTPTTVTFVAEPPIDVNNNTG
jgi:hypothetical protein